ncbi:MAG: hydrogenase [Acidobacteriota bacterium]
MSGPVLFLLVGVVLLDLLMAATSRLRVLIRGFALQAAATAGLALLLDGFESPHAWLVAVGILLLKSTAIPYFLNRAVVRTGARRDLEPLVSYGTSLLLASLGVALSFVFASRLPMVARRAGILLAAAAFATMLTGLLLLVSRMKALSQVAGYLVLENGIFLFGLTLLRRMPLLVEMGILLDVFVGVFVMGIVVYNIHRTFDHIDVRSLTALREDEP